MKKTALKKSLRYKIVLGRIFDERTYKKAISNLRGIGLGLDDALLLMSLTRACGFYSTIVGLEKKIRKALLAAGVLAWIRREPI